MKQHQSSPSTPIEFQKLLAEVSDERFLRAEGRASVGSKESRSNKKVPFYSRIECFLDKVSPRLTIKTNGRSNDGVALAEHD